MEKMLVTNKKIPLYLSTGAFTGRVNNRNPHLLTRFWKELACDGFEWMIMDCLLPEAGALIAEYRAEGIPIPLVHTRKEIGDWLSTPGEEGISRALALFSEDCALARAAGATRAVVHPWGLPESDGVFSRTLERLGALYERSLQEGIELLVENCVCTYGSPLSHLEALAAAYPSMGLLVDTRCSEFHAETGRTASSPLWKKNIRHVHINDYRGGYKDWDHRYPIYQPGEGQICWDAFFSAIARGGYCGSVTLEAAAMLPDRVDTERLNKSLRFIRNFTDKISKGTYENDEN